MNVLGIVIDFAGTQVFSKGTATRTKLLIMPKYGKNPKDVAVTKRYMIATVLLSFVITIVLLIL